ncbi:bacteriocin-associated integral membrane family protein [Xylocopilactobacillus apicola]|uniref:Bacteriocin-associated integral membrane protein n=1 Tax=Xylocopilactobacillus apicola TaxID=2932184 RepID=A0AAU9D8S6_9LACO|nr:DUF1430 domain-containing protein [Xylocopilactobacillus apicola]BDR58796.1 hypothetical protein XA3_12370 [Xylocopilactobacillus apicola]
MKKIFLVFSSAVVLLFLAFSLQQKKEHLNSVSYPSVDIINPDPKKEQVDRAKFERELNEFASVHHILIAKGVLVGSKTEADLYTYMTYGEGKIPQELKQANKSDAKASDVTSGYLIVRGNLDSQLLVNKFRELGYNAVSFEKISFLRSFIVLLNETAVLCVLIFLLTFSGLSLIYRIKDLRFAGIRLVAGESLLTVTLRPVIADFKTITLINGGMWLVGLLVLGFNHSLQFNFALLLAFGAILYAALLLFISLAFSIIYLFSLHNSKLMSLINGRLPLKRILGVMLLAQFIAIVTVGFTVKQFSTDYASYEEMNQAQNKWQAAKDRYLTTYSWAAGGVKKTEADKTDQLCYDFLNEAVNQQDALLCENRNTKNLPSFLRDKVDAAEYGPDGNAIYVTPNYLIKQNVEISSELKERLQHLKPGEFGLLFPEKLKGQEQELTQAFLKSWNSLFDESKYQGSSFEVVKGYLANNQKRFYYNSGLDSMTTTQFIKDPIIVVWTPTSTRSTPGSNMYWAATLSSRIAFKDYDSTIKLLKKYKLYKYMGLVESGLARYQRTSNELKTRLISLLIGSALSIVTSIFMFTLMNLLYFEEFRREIFIKRIAGLSFTEIHFNYLLAQLATLMVASIAGFWLTKDLAIITGTTVLFLGIGAVLTYRQFKHEDEIAATVMKGQ